MYTVRNRIGLMRIKFKKMFGAFLSKCVGLTCLKLDRPRDVVIHIIGVEFCRFATVGHRLMSSKSIFG